MWTHGRNSESKMNKKKNNGIFLEDFNHLIDVKQWYIISFS